ncbi:MAG: alpha/beta fold hydrolase [Ktedonobacterales bacterium]
MDFPPPSFVTVDGRRLAYDEVTPSNPRGTVLLLTGLGSKRLGWYKQMEVFGAEYRTIALDHRDTGDSDLATGPYTTADQAEDAAAVLRALGIQRAAVVGISMGGFIAQELALLHPEMVEKLVLVSTSAGGPGYTPPAAEIAARLVEPRTGDLGERTRATYTAIMAPGYAASHPAEIGRIVEIALYRPQSNEAYMRQLQSGWGRDATSRLSQLHTPVLVVHGEADPLIPIQNGRYLAAHIPGARLVEYPDTGHIPIIERAGDFNREVLAFLAHG